MDLKNLKGETGLLLKPVSFSYEGNWSGSSCVYCSVCWHHYFCAYYKMCSRHIQNESVKVLGPAEYAPVLWEAISCQVVTFLPDTHTFWMFIGWMIRPDRLTRGLSSSLTVFRQWLNYLLSSLYAKLDKPNSLNLKTEEAAKCFHTDMSSLI